MDEAWLNDINNDANGKIPPGGFHYYEYGACDCRTCVASDLQVDAHKARIAAQEIVDAADIIALLDDEAFATLTRDELLGW